MESFLNSLRMLEKRGYDISSWKRARAFEIDEDEFNTIMKDNINSGNCLVKSLLPSLKVTNVKYAYTYLIPHMNQMMLVFFTEEENSKVSIESIRNLSRLIDAIKNQDQTDNLDIILIVRTQLSNESEKEIAKISKSNYIQIFNHMEIKSDPNDCDWGSKYTFLTKEDKYTFLSKNDIIISNLPRISSKDAPLKYMGCKPGTLIQITRNPIIDGSSIKEYITYAITY